MTFCIGRRDFIALLGGAAVWPLAARAQQPAMPVIGFLSTREAADSVHVVAAFQNGLKEVGFVEGQTVTVQYHWAGSRNDRLPELAANMVRARVAVIAAIGPLAALAAKGATATIPIVFTVGSDPVEIGLVASLGRPAGNATGVNIFSAELGAKRLGLLNDLMPTASVVALLVNPHFPNVGSYVSEVETAARMIGKQIRVLNAGNEDEIQQCCRCMPKRFLLPPTRFLPVGDIKLWRWRHVTRFRPAMRRASSLRPAA
jgi:putative tryptophan/tyrosine transport system substrate-binding protein